MYEGKHIHFAEDHKPLCSCSTKVCKQRRLNGYAFCIRHILEDKSAPYYQCEFINRYNGQTCTNPIRQGGDSKFCVSHLQVLGVVPKKGKKLKTGDGPSAQNHIAGTEKHVHVTGGQTNKLKNPKEKKKKDKHKRKHEKHKNRLKKTKTLQNDSAVTAPDANINSLELLLRSSTPLVEPSNFPSVSNPHGAHNGPTDKPKKKSHSRQSSLQDRKREKFEKNKARLKLQREQELQARLQQTQSKVEPSPDHCSTSPSLPFSAPSSLSLSEPPLFMDLNEHLPTMPPHLAHSKINLPFAVSNLPPLSASVVQAPAKKPRTLYTKKLGLESLDKLREIYQTEEEKRLDLFSLGLEYSSDEDDEERVPYYSYTPRFPDYNNSCSSSSSSDRPSRQDRLSELSSRLRSQCACVVQSYRCQRTQRLKSKRLCLALIKAAREHSFGAVVSLLGYRRQPLTRPKVELPPDRTCVSKEEGGEQCQEEAMPYSSHCYRHVLEDEHQELFHQCTAEFPGGFRCIEPAFDMQNDNPLCLEHNKRMRLQPKQKKPRKKTKPSALTRPNKKKKTRRNIRPQKPIPPAFPQSNSGFPSSFTILPRLSLPVEIDSDMNLDLNIDTSDLRMSPDGDNSDLCSEGEGSDLSEILPKLPMDIPDLSLFEPEEFTKFVKEHEEAGKNGDSDYMPIPMPTKEEQEELERAILEVSKTVNSVQESLDQLSKQSMDSQLPNSNAMFDEHDNSCDSGDQDGVDGLPRDLRSAANRLLQDALRQNSVETMSGSMHHPMELPSGVSSSNLPGSQVNGPLHVMTSMSGQTGYHDNSGHFGGVRSLLSQTPNPMGQLHGQQLEPLRMPGPILMGNGMVPMSSAMLNLQRQMSNSPQSPIGNPMSPHQVLAPHSSPFTGSTMLQQPRTLAGQPSPMHSPVISLTSANTQHMTLPSFRQTWSVAPSPTASPMLTSSNLLNLINQHSPDSNTPTNTPNHTPSLYPQMTFPQKFGDLPMGGAVSTTDSALAKALGMTMNTHNSTPLNSAGQNHQSYSVSQSSDSVPTTTISSLATNFTTKASTVS